MSRIHNLIKQTSFPALAAVAGGFGIALACSTVIYRKMCEQRISASKFLKDAVDEMAKHDEIINLLGGKYELGKIQSGDSWNKIEKSKIRVRLPINGAARNANLLVYAHRSGDSLEINRLEMSFDKIDSRRLLILDRPIETELEAKPATNEIGEELLFVRRKG